MVTSNAGDPGTGWMSQYRPFLISVPLLQDELLSTWLTRVALTYGCDPLVLSGELWPASRVWTKDLDRGLSGFQLGVLSRVSGIDVSTLDGAGLRSIVSAVTGCIVVRQAIWPWILALGARNRKHQGGLQYCPSCLATDIKPYYRKHWRYAWHTGCMHHHEMLCDRCPYCYAPIEPHRAQAGDDLTQCVRCQRDLAHVPTSRVDNDAIAFQNAADLAIKFGVGRYGPYILSCEEWFLLSKYITRLLRRAVLGGSNRLAHFVQLLGVDIETLCTPVTGLALELLSVKERAMILASVWRILQAGPKRFLDAAMSEEMKAESLKNMRQSTPKCIEKLLALVPAKHLKRQRKKRVNTLSPRSKQSVERMWARLQRKTWAMS